MNDLNNYNLIEIIGNGATSIVWKGFYQTIKTPIAIKIIEKNNIEINKNQILEIFILQKINHPFISSIFDSFEDEFNIYLILEYFPNGNLLEFINLKGKLNEDIAKKYFSQLVSVLLYLHKEKKVIHRDIKLENLLLDQYFNLKLIDFGLSNYLENDSI